MERGPSAISHAGSARANGAGSIEDTPPARVSEPARKHQPMALFNGLPGDLLKKLFEKAKTLDLAAKAELFAAGSPGEECYRIEKGSLKVGVISRTGVERTLAIVGAGSVIGEMSMLDGQPRSATVTALTDCRLQYIRRAEFRRFAANEPAIYEHLTRLLVSMVRHTDSSIAAGAFLSIEGRLAWAFLQLAQEFGAGRTEERITIRLKLSQTDIGNLAGISREHTSRILNKWMRQGLLTRAENHYTIQSMEQLKRIAQL